MEGDLDRRKKSSHCLWQNPNVHLIMLDFIYFLSQEFIEADFLLNKKCYGHVNREPKSFVLISTFPWVARRLLK